MQMTSTKQAPTKVSKEAVERAYQDNLKALDKRIAGMSEKAFLDFLKANFDTIHNDPWMKGKNLALMFDIAIGYEQRPESVKAKNLADLRKLLRDYVSGTRQDVRPLMQQIKGLKIRTPEEAQKIMDEHAANIAASNAELLQAAYSVGHGLKTALYTTASTLALPFMLAHYLAVKPTASLWSAIRKRFQITGAQSAIILTTLFALTGGPIAIDLTRKVDTTQYRHLYVSTELSKRIFTQACRYEGVQEGSMMTLAYALAFMPTNLSDPKYETKMLHFMSAMSGTEQGVEPIVLDLLSRMETGNFLSTWAKGSSARGPYQTIDMTALAVIAMNGTNIPLYKEAKGKTDKLSREMYLALTRLAKDWSIDNGKTVKARFARGIVPLAYTAAINFARQPLVAGQLQAAEILRVAPELSIENLKGKPLSFILEVLSTKVYPPHLLGDEGSQFLNFVAEKSPDTFMDDVESLKKLYVQYSGSTDKKTIDSMASYYMTLLPGNPAIRAYLPSTSSPARVKPAEYKAAIAKSVLGTVDTGAQAFNAVYTKEPNAYDACVVNKEQLTAEAIAIEQQIPRTTTKLDIYWRTHVSLEHRELAAAFYTRAINYFWPEKVPAEGTSEEAAQPVKRPQGLPTKSL
ncbi:MAG: hypothetical protein EBQ96_02485 [Proteobacteria bacterium]|nr:hypothetical protein [Pseudomonadota bacterium]